MVPDHEWTTADPEFLNLNEYDEYTHTLKIMYRYTPWSLSKSNGVPCVLRRLQYSPCRQRSSSLYDAVFNMQHAS